MDHEDTDVLAPRRSGLATKDVAGEVVVYDLDSDKVHLLNLVTTCVWRLAEGGTATTQDAVRAVTEAFPDQEGAADLARAAVVELRSLGLLEASAGGLTMLDRRRMLKIAGGAALLGPLVTTILAPPAAASHSPGNPNCHPLGFSGCSLPVHCCSGVCTSGTCSCLSAGQTTCTANTNCCAGTICKTTSGNCCKAISAADTSCNANNQCCSGQCSGTNPAVLNKCCIVRNEAVVTTFNTCTAGTQCCTNTDICLSGRCCVTGTTVAGATGATCQNAKDCCSGSCVGTNAKVCA